MTDMPYWIALVEALALERVHQNPRIETIKALAERAEYQSVRFVIYETGDFVVGDAGRFTHQQIAPATRAWAAYLNSTASCLAQIQQRLWPNLAR